MSKQIKKDIQAKLNIMKSTTNENDKNIAYKIEKIMNSINCLYCLDSKRLWGLRDQNHVFWGNLVGRNERFWIGSCFQCGEHQFIRDSYENEIVCSNGYKMFLRDDATCEERFKELKRVAVENLKSNAKLVVATNTNTNTNTNTKESENDIVVVPLSPVVHVEEKSDFELVLGRKIDYKKDNISFEIGIKKLVEMLGGILQAHIGIPNLPLLKEIEASVSYESISEKKEEMFCHTTKNNECFVFVLLKDSSEQTKGSFFKIAKGDKCNMHIECKYWIFKPKNATAIEECKKMMLCAANNELLSLSNNLNTYYENNH